MKIDEPKTPFVHSASVPPMEDEGAPTQSRDALTAGFNLDVSSDAPAAPIAEASAEADALPESTEVEANTRANASSHLVEQEQPDAAREHEAFSAEQGPGGGDDAPMGQEDDEESEFAPQLAADRSPS